MAKIGRPTKYDEVKTKLKLIEKLASYGLTEAEIGDVIGVSRNAIHNYKQRYPEFDDILKRGKVKADAKVVEKLYKRTQGYEYEETTTEGKLIDGKIVPTNVKKIKKHIPPDVTACMCWLNNRRRRDWRQKQDEYSGDELNPEFSKMSDDELRKYIEARIN